LDRHREDQLVLYYQYSGHGRAFTVAATVRVKAGRAGPVPANLAASVHVAKLRRGPPVALISWPNAGTQRLYWSTRSASMLASRAQRYHDGATEPKREQAKQ